MVEIDIEDICEDLIETTISSYLKNNHLLGLLNGSIDTGEELFNAFDGFRYALKFPQFLLEHHYNTIEPNNR